MVMAGNCRGHRIGLGHQLCEAASVPSMTSGCDDRNTIENEVFPGGFHHSGELLPSGQIKYKSS
jgi:hypothetical protein